MTYRQGYVLSRRMRANGNGRKLTARVHRQTVHCIGGDHLEEVITFEGGLFGPFTMPIRKSEERLVVDQWLAYCELAGVPVTWVSSGQAVTFTRRRSSSRPRRAVAKREDDRVGVIVWVTPTRCLIEYPRRDRTPRRKRGSVQSRGMKTWRKLDEVTLVNGDAP